MNFLILSAEGKVIARPDSTRNKDNGDYFAPTDVNSIGFTPAVYARMSRTGKMIGREFVPRYYDAVAFGILVYPSTAPEDKPHYCKATSSIFDKTSLLPLPMYNPVTLERDGNIFRISKDSRELFTRSTVGISEILADALTACSQHTTIHKGDFVIAELDSVKTMGQRSEGDFHIGSTFCENEIIDIDVKF